jgi:hypothetical protein
MNFIEAIEAVKNDCAKVFVDADGNVLKECTVMFCRRVVYKDNHTFTNEELPALMQLDFHEVVDWSKVASGTKLICTDSSGIKHTRYFGEYLSESKTIKAHELSDFWTPDHVRLAEDV